jgi:hypothetical protein
MLTSMYVLGSDLVNYSQSLVLILADLCPDLAGDQYFNLAFGCLKKKGRNTQK